MSVFVSFPLLTIHKTLFWPLLSRTTQSQISARLLINSCSLWWSGQRGSLTSVSCLWMTRSSYCVLVNLFYSFFTLN